MAVTKSAPVGNVGFERLILAAAMGSASAAQASTNAEVVLAGSDVDLTFVDILSIDLVNSGANAIDIKFYTANKEDFTDEVLFRTVSTLAAAATLQMNGSSSGTAAALIPWRFLRIKIKSSVTDTPGACWGTIHGK